MATPVQTDKWAGNFDCGTCRRKRLMGSEFSKKALERFRKEGGELKCKQCVAEAEVKEREAAAARRAATATGTGETTGESRICLLCKKSLPQTDYNRNQWSKGEGKSKCKTCVETAIQQDQKQQEEAKEQKVKDAQKAVADAHASGNAAAILKAESFLAALEAEKVTGLKPTGTKRGGGRGRGRGGRTGGGRAGGRGRR